MRLVSRQRRIGIAPVSCGVLCVSVFLSGCGLFQKHYALRGRVLAKSSSDVTVNQENIPGFMPPMTMPYAVKDLEALEKVQPGDAITADLVVRGKTYWLDHVVIIGSAGRGSVSTATDNTDIEDENGTSVIGAMVPDLKLVNQDGKTLHLSNFKGKTVLITFIYTRCPFPTFCPLLSSEFAAIQRELAKTPGLYKQTHLISVSLDPAYDTPPILRKYGLGYLKDDPSGFAHWDFVVTSPEDLKTFAGAFGLTYFEQDNLITHSMRTILVTPDGTVANIWDGSEWRQPELVDAIKQATPGQ
jgi:protein SCO1/2